MNQDQSKGADTQSVDAIDPYLSIIRFILNYPNQSKTKSSVESLPESFLEDIRRWIRSISSSSSSISGSVPGLNHSDRSIDKWDENTQSVRVASFLTSLSMTGLDKNPQVIASFVDEIFKHWNLGSLPDTKIHELDRSRPICDIVGTGGDGFNTFNVSTTAAIVASGAGLKICKHGNRASSSASGSADLLMTLGIPLDRLNPQQVSKLMRQEDFDFNFLFSQTFYPIFKRLGPIRKTLGFPTIFNRLGPLLNPIRPDRMIIGISDSKLGPTYCEALKSLGLDRSWIVCGDRGLDEISTTGPTSLWRLREDDGSIEHVELDPVSSFGLKVHPMDRLTISGPKDSLKTLDLLLDHSDQPPQDESHAAKLDFVLMNTSALLVLGGAAKDFREGVSLARDSLTSGRARAALEKFKSRSLAILEQ